MTKPVTLKEVAGRAGVSVSVASRALSGDPDARLAAETVQRVRSAAAQLNYLPDHRARALRSAKSGALGLVVPSVTNSIFAELFAGVQEAAAREGMTVLLAQVDGDRPQTLAGIVGHGRVDGAIVQRPETLSDRALLQLLSAGPPAVLFNSRLAGRVGSVTLADAEGAAVATKHVIALGHRRIAFIGGTRVHDAARRRRSGFIAAMHSAGLTVDPDLDVEAGWEAEAGARAATRLVDLPQPPTALVVASVNAALGATAAVQEAGVDVPGEMCVVAVQDTGFAAYFSPALTVVRMPLREAGAAAASMLLGHLRGNALRDITVDTPAPTLVVRRSTAPVRSGRRG